MLRKLIVLTGCFLMVPCSAKMVLADAAMPPEERAVIRQQMQEEVQKRAKKEAEKQLEGVLEQVQIQEKAYGWQLMTPEELDAYRLKMQSLKTREEREAFRAKQHQKMLERAREQNVILPEMAPDEGPGAGFRSGHGFGPGSGRGPASAGPK